MNWLAEITLLRPLWLLALPLVIALAVISAGRVAQLGDWTRQIDPHLMAAMAALGRVETAGRRMDGYLPFWVAGCIVLALAGPAIERGNGQSFRNLDGVVFAVDVSDSMTLDDTWPASVTMVRAGLSVLGTKPVSLIIFAGDSYAVSPLTTDHAQLGQTVALLDENTVPDKGTRPELALRQSAEILETSNILAGDVVLVTDGAGLGPDALVVAQKISDLGGRLSVVHAKTTIDETAAVAVQSVDALTKIGGGSVYGLGEAHELMQMLADSSDTRLERQEMQLLFWTDYGRYLLFLALIPALGFFRREGA